MAVGRYSRKKLLKQQNEQSLCRCVIAVFQVAVFCQSVNSIAAQDFLQSSFQADGIVQGSSLFPRPEVDAETSAIAVQLDPNQEVTSQADVIRFDPPYLDFDVQPIGIPSMRIVRVYNPSKTKSLWLNSISARTSHFHSSFFDKKVIPARGNTTFEVVFLARVVGNVENTLFINTAMGAFSYQVFGIGISNPYRLRPYLGAKVSLNSTFSPLISIHNPTGTPLQVTEVYTSSGYLHLQLPSGLYEGKKQLWEIPPYETRPVMQANFFGQVVDNHTAFIRIRTNHTDFAQYLILAMEVEVTTTPGIYSSLETLDFGTLRTKDEPKALNLFLLNSGSKEVQISSVTAQPPNPAIDIDFMPLKLRPSEATYTRVANISFDVSKVNSEEQWSGKILVRTKEKSYSKLSISYQVNILDGNLGYDESSTLFLIPIHNVSKLASAQNISITNTFAFPIVLHKLELPDNTASFYEIANFSSPCVVGAQETVSCFSLLCEFPAFQTLSVEKMDVLNSIHHLILHTNASTFSMPLRAYTGMLTFKIQGGNLPDLDFGIMGTLDKRSMILSLDNLNPVQVSLLDFNTSVNAVEVNVISLRKDGENVDGNVITQFRNVIIPPGSSLKLEVVLSAPKTESTITGSFDFYTNYEKLEIPIKARIAVGSLTIKPSKFQFRPTFPGSIVQQTFTIASSFAQTMKIEGLTCADKRFYYRKHKNVGSELEPGKELKIGKVYFDPKLNCKPGRCYVGLPTSTTAGHHWLTTISLGKNAAEVDSKLYKNHQDMWKKMKEQNETSINTKFQLTTNLVRNFDIDISASLYWPSLVEEPVHEYPLTHIGKKWLFRIPVSNPSDIPVIVQILPISIYPQPLTALSILGMDHILETDGFTYTDSNVFNVSLDPTSSTQDTSSQMVWLEYTLNGKTNKSCVNMFLNPGQTQLIDVTFAPVDNNPVSTMFLIRNNLTVMDAFEVRGRGVEEIIKLGGKLSNDPNSSLKFKLTESLLRDCFVQNRKDKASPSYTVRKSFTAKNLGLLQVQVRYLMVDNYPCEGYGFRILDCDPFVLQPNETKEIIIAYTPDFTTSQVSHTLRIWTSQGNILTFNLNVSLPHHLLPICQSSIPRPLWERPLYFGFVILTLLGFVGIILISYLEAMTTLEPVIVRFENEMAKCDGQKEKGKIFNLQDIGADLGASLNEDGKPRDKSRASLSRGIPAHRKSSFAINSFLQSVSQFTNSVLSFDLIKFLKNSWSRGRDLTPERDHSADIFKRKVPEVAPELLCNNIRNLSPNPITSNGNSKTRHRQNRKSKSSPPHQSTPSKMSMKNELRRNKVPPVEPLPPMSWTINAPESPKRTKVIDDDKLDTASASSVESSRSRGSSVSSGNMESDHKKRNDDNSTAKRKRKNKVSRQPSYIRDLDDSSTTTEKSLEDFEVKPTCESPVNEIALCTNSKPLHVHNKTSSDSDYKELYCVPSHYNVTHEPSNLRRRHPRTSSLPVEPETLQKPKFSKKSTNFRNHYDTSSTDEPSWDSPKPTINRRENDDVMKSLSDATRKVDKKMRRNARGGKVDFSSRGSLDSFNSSISNHHNSHQSPGTSSISPTLIQTSKPSLPKSQSMPEKPSPPRHQTSFDNLLPNHRRSSNNEQAATSILPEQNLPYPAPGFSPVISAPAWNSFNQNSYSFGITESIVPPASATAAIPATSPGITHWATYPTTSLFSNSTTSHHPPTSTWNQNSALQINIPPPTPGTLNSPISQPASPVISEAQDWGNTSPRGRSTHAIWSVSNAVMMDEDRNTAENDPLGLRNIWSKGSYPSDGRTNFF